MTNTHITELITPTDARYDNARKAWNLTVDQRPAAIAMPRNADEIAGAVTRAAASGYRVAIQGTGHGAPSLGSLDGTVLVKTSAMRGVTIAPAALLARVEAGAVWADVVGAAAEHGLAALAGSSHDVGVAGYTLGGGVSSLSRRYGLAANSVLAAEVVTADGHLHRIDLAHEPDLFWALRGGGGSFAAVTALEIRLIPLQDVIAGVLFFPLDRALDVLRGWRRWVAHVPDEISSSARLLQFPPLPHIPEPVRGRSFVAVEIVHLGNAAKAEKLLAPLRELQPVRDTVSRKTPVDLLGIHMDPPGPVPGVGDGMQLDQLPAEAIDALLAAAGPGSGSRLLSVELRHLGGALGRSAPESGALTALEGDFLLYAVGMAPEPSAAATVRGRIGQIKQAMAPWQAARDYLNFAEGGHDATRFFAPDVLARLRQVKQTYDPADVFQSNHPVTRGRLT